MTESGKTTAFASVGGVMLALAVLTWFVTQPKEINEFENVGQPFFEEFDDSGAASSLEVLAMDTDSAKLKTFRVEEKDGVWTIPSHYGYPAEASDRLAKTSSSLIGLTRESLVGRLKKDHERFGVVDPLGEDVLDPEATGKRITLKDYSGDVLVDLIIGKEADEQDATEEQIAFGQATNRKNYYVRRPDETQTYKIGMDLELSTKFSDWIRPDLLNLDASELRQVAIDNYELQEQADPLGRLTRLFKKQGDHMLFNRDAGFGPWNLEGLDEETKQLDAAKINAAVTALTDLKIVGVRKKTAYKGKQILNADLTLNKIPELETPENIAQYRQLMAQIQQELSEYGFNLTPVAQGSQELTLVSNFGEMKAGTENGIAYTLQFGSPVSGDENEIEIGSSGTSAKSEEVSTQGTEASEAADSEAAADDEAAGEGADEKEEEKIENRFLMIRVAFDETLLGEKPVAPEKPIEPEKPEGYVPAPAPEDKPDDADDAPTPDQDEAAESDNETADKIEEPGDDRPIEFKDYDLSKQEYDELKTTYELELSKFEDARTSYEEKVEAGQKRVAELNERFGAWFYVISADNLEALQATKDELVTDKEPVEPVEPADQLNGGLPARPNLDIGIPEPIEPDLTDDTESDAPTNAAETDSADSEIPAETGAPAETEGDGS